MSWDASLFVPVRESGDVIGRLHHWCSEHPSLKHTTGEPGSTEQGQWWYETPDTGVYFSVDYGPPAVVGAPGEAAAEPDVLDGYVRAGIALSINLARPHFFGLEAIPLVVALADGLGCSVLDLQGSERPEATNAEALLSTWNHGNDVGRRILLEQSPDRPRWSQAMSKQWWGYQHGKRAYEDGLAEDVFVPTLLLVTLAGEAEVQSVVVWPDEIPFVFPPCDLLVASHDVRKLLRKKRIEQVFRASDVRRALAGRLQPLEVEGSVYEHLSPDNSPGAVNLLRHLDPLGSADLLRDRGVGADCLVDF